MPARISLARTVLPALFGRVIDTDAELGKLLPKLAATSVIALDTEADSLHAYPEKVCLIQVTHTHGDDLIDPLAGLDLKPLLQVLKNKPLILHGADYDLRMLHRTYGFIPEEIFDTMTAARLLGFDQFGLNHLVQRELGVTLEKGPQKMNWARRPLTERMSAYARNDTHYLHALKERLENDLNRVGRLEWQRQVCQRLIQECTQPIHVEPDEIWRVKGSDRLGRRALSVLRSLWHWREQEARAFNTPPFFILDHDSLIRLATAASEDPDGDHTIRIRTTTRRKEGLREALRLGLSVPLSEQPHPRRVVRYYPSAAERKRFTQYKEFRDAKAKVLSLDPSLLASKAMLITLAQDWDQGKTALMPWQLDLLEGARA